MARRRFSFVLLAMKVAVVACSSSGGSGRSSPTSVVHDDASRPPPPALVSDSGPDGGGDSTAASSDASAREDAGDRARDEAGEPAAFDSGAEPDARPTPLPPLVCAGAGPRFATSVVAHRFGPGQSLGQTHFPAWVLGPPVGGGACQGAVDGVVSLGNGGTVTLAFGDDGIVDGPGPDFIVFENAFGVACDLTNVFAELATVEVSDDGISWKQFPCTATKPPYGLCAGARVVYANADTNTLDPTDPAVAGGDPFDLSDVGLARARLVRLTDRADLTGLSGVFDLDAVSIVNPACP